MLRFILLLLVAASPISVLAQDNPLLLNIIEVQPSAEVSIQSDAYEVTINRDEVISWVEAAMDSSDFGRAYWSGEAREDSIAFLHLGLYIVPQSDGTMVTTALFRVYRPGSVLDVPLAQSIMDVPVMENAFAFVGSETYLRAQIQSLTGQFIGYVANRIAEHNPKRE